VPVPPTPSIPPAVQLPDEDGPPLGTPPVPIVPPSLTVDELRPTTPLPPRAAGSTELVPPVRMLLPPWLVVSAVPLDCSRRSPELKAYPRLLSLPGSTHE
jgi:hypothetical protein